MLKYLIAVSIILTSCSSTYKTPSKKYSDQLLSSHKNPHGTTTNTFLRHGLTYVDKTKKNKLIERNVYDKGQLIYRYPILRSNLKPSKIYLRSGNNVISKTKTDTVVFINSDLPVMNRHFWGKGIMLSKLSDSTYIGKAISENSRTATFYISTSDNYEEIQNDKGFIADSLVLSVR